MKTVLVAAALLLVSIGPAAAANFGCWSTKSVATNNSPSGTWRLTVSSSSDYLEAMNTGVSSLLSGLSAFNNGTFAICMEGTSATVSNKKVWRLTSVVICPTSRVAYNACQS